MAKLKYYAGIGARVTPEPVLIRMAKLAYKLSNKGYTLRSGGARGADSAFERGCIGAGGDCEIILPREDSPLWCEIFTEFFHPHGSKIKDWPRQAMNRNAEILLGSNGNSPVDFVVCWTDNGRIEGGTGHAIKIANYFEIPVYNFAKQKDLDKLRELMKEI